MSEAYDGSASHYETVFGIILGSGCGGGLVINKKIISGSNGLGGEWSLNQMPDLDIPNLKTVFLKPLYGDASGVRGAALLGRDNFI